MNDATLIGFRQIADALCGARDWQWIGPYRSQRMFGISKDRAKDYASTYGGEAKMMPTREEMIVESDRFLAKRKASSNNECAV
jgi:hypothetical protein